MGQLPVTCGLYFSLGHSTIVIVVVWEHFRKSYVDGFNSVFQNVAIAISTDIYGKLDNVGRVGGIVGMTVSCYEP